MTTPKVSFVVPCFKLAHLLPECIASILKQTYTDFEVLILNDCSPDNTAEIARTFDDPRVQLIDNPVNLGNLRTYNKGIKLSRGAYVWLISADDYLLKPYVLERFIRLLDARPDVGYVFCPGIGVVGGEHRQLLGEYRKQDCVVDGKKLLKKLLQQNFILAPGVLVRRECYEQISDFPLEVEWKGTPIQMKWLGDWYLWCRFALVHDVGYFAEPMVCYRMHELSMTNDVTQPETVQACAESDLAMLWLMKHHATELNYRYVAADCLKAIANEYRRQGASKHFRASTYVLHAADFERSLCRNTADPKERRLIRARYRDGAGNRYLALGQLDEARRCYLGSIRDDPSRIKLYGKLLFLQMGGLGLNIRRMFGGFRRTSRANAS
jgi:glycosyltransferase involved in cell wall biosynthesis